MIINSLYISNFKGFKEIKIPKLGHLNLIVGKNNSGKSSLLEALMLYASAGSESVFHEISINHDEKSRERGRLNEYSRHYKDDKNLDLNENFPYEHLFYGRKFNSKTPIRIGEIDSESKHLTASYFKQRKDTTDNHETLKLLQKLNVISNEMLLADSTTSQQNILEVKKGRNKHIIPLDEPLYRVSRSVESDEKLRINFKYVPTKTTSMDDLGGLWDQIALTPYERYTIDALRLIEPHIEDLRFVVKEDRNGDRTAILKLFDEDIRFPIRSMGDGIVRILQLILNMYAAKDGFYLIDEFDNGLHYSVQKSLWKMIFSLSEQFNIQVFATTHSWDCIQSFSEVAVENEGMKGCLLKIGKSKLSKNKGNAIVTIFDEETLHSITQEMVEVR
jgi:AAA15 family ATPase/GTPase